MKHLFMLLFLCAPILQAQVKNTIKSQNLSVISLEKGNIVYRGINNPLKIAVPGTKSFTATAPGLTKIDEKGNYNFIVTAIPGDSVTIKLDIMAHKKVIHEQKVFAIRDIPNLYATIGNRHCSCVMGITKTELSNSEIQIQANDFFNTSTSQLYVSALNILWPDGNSTFMYGNTIDENSKKLINLLPLGAILRIDVFYDTKGSGKYRLRGVPRIEVMIISDDIGNFDEYYKPFVNTENLSGIYKNEKNKINIVIPGTTSFTAKAPGLTKIDTLGNYILDTKYSNGKNVTIEFEAAVYDSVFQTSKTITITDRYTLKSTINGQGCEKCIVELPVKELDEARIEVRNNDYSENVIAVKGFVVQLPDKKSIKVKGAIITEDISKKIRSLKTGASILIKDIEYQAPRNIYGNINAPDIRILIKE